MTPLRWAQSAACVRSVTPICAVDARQMRLHGLLADRQRARDQLVREPLRDHRQHLRSRSESASAAPAPGSRAEERTGGLRVERRLAARRGLDRASQLGGLRVLQQVPGRTGVERAQDPLAVRERGEDDDRDVRAARPGSSVVASIPSSTGISRSISTTSGCALGADRHRLLAVRRGSDELDARERREELREPGPHDARGRRR